MAELFFHDFNALQVQSAGPPSRAKAESAGKKAESLKAYSLAF
ncbi:MAG: hypothetical protein NT067_06680 [Candidatus Diapherotrites archaeon]|nr:hypothetical protein [Candidatus Diapherotrites archaeon]